jgi:hypothetical protein
MIRYKKCGSIFHVTKNKFIPKKSTERGQFIVTLTSYGRRLANEAPYAISSIMNQRVPPDRIVLWLECGTTIPNKIRKLEAKGLEIKFCEDIGSYTKLVPSLREFPNHILITADDDTYYFENWFEALKSSYQCNPHKIHCHKARQICFDDDKNLLPYSKWKIWNKTIEYNNKCIFPLGVSGVLYPPGTLHENVVNKNEFMELCPTGDDIWFWFMARLKGTEHELVKGNKRYIFDIGKYNSLSQINRMGGKNDEQITKMIIKYPEVLDGIRLSMQIPAC